MASSSASSDDDWSGTGITFTVLPPDDSLQTCPYNTHHEVRKRRFDAHVSKCHQRHVQQQRAKGQPSLYSICKYNCTHHVLNEDLERHYDTCPTRKLHGLNFGADGRAANKGASSTGYYWKTEPESSASANCKIKHSGQMAMAEEETLSGDNALTVDGIKFKKWGSSAVLDYFKKQVEEED